MASKRKTYSQKFLVERIVHRRKAKHGHDYLIKWQGWALEHCTWEPEEHLGDDLLRFYEQPPKPAEARLQEAARNFYGGILSALKSSCLLPFYVNMDLDVWRYVGANKGADSGHRGYRLYSIQDLNLLRLPHNWWYHLNEHGEGQAVEVPLKIRALVTWTPKSNMVIDGKLQPCPRMPQEKLCVDILKRSCNLQNLFT